MAAIRTQQLERAVRSFLATGSGTRTSAEIAARAAPITEQLVRHLSRLLGATGSRTLLNRSLHLASAAFPWLASADAQALGPVAALRARMESESPAAATEAFVCVLSTLVELLERLIGEALVGRVLHEVWPAMFPAGPKETM